MLKVAKTLPLKDFMEANSAVILGSEPSFGEQVKPIVEEESLHFDIYADGSIARSGSEDSKVASYTYYDKNGEAHELGQWRIKINDTRYKNGKEKKPKTGDYVVRYSPIYEADIYYAKIPGKMHLINIKKKPLNYKKDDLLISYFHNSNREYVDIGAFASFIGALAEVSYDDVVLNGFTNADGIGNPSKTHVNGIYGDLRYFNKNKVKKKLLITSPEFDELRQNNFINALYKFGYKGMASFKYGEKNDKLVHHGKHVKGHKNHLHIQGYDLNHIKKQ
ncbi:hypothetical protein GCM10007384_18620 [Aquimarina muelleri]|uniref:Uncharacterized protein n=1 Tax=Aquimarina muelleri TaxID=279356 RepID=A0A918JUW6_9FLAO|nr:hypothetical protein GCM10007384_18620 [Aquimarina muelleri]